MSNKQVNLCEAKISLEQCSCLPYLSYLLKNTLTCLKLCSPTFNLNLFLKNGILFDPFTLMRGVQQGCPLRYLPISLKRAKGIQIEDHGIEIVDFADDAAIFLGDITCLNRIQVILKLFEDASRSKINVSKAKHHGMEHIRIELINQDKVNGHNVPLKDLE